MTVPDVDIIIIGAGLAGINTAYRIHTNLPNHRYIVLESSSQVGGTWQTFRYPGLRADSDIYTYSYPWYPWTTKTSASPRADGPAILQYLKDAARSFGMDAAGRLYLEHKVATAEWETSRRRWRVSSEHKGRTAEFHARFIIYTTGIFSHGEPRDDVHIPGLGAFGGRVVHPQFWPQDLDHRGKRIIIVGSGATAITLLAELAKTAAHVTMVQRSPAYLVSLPGARYDLSARWLRTGQAAEWVFRLKRWLWLSSVRAFFVLCLWLPGLMRWILISLVRWQLPSDIPVDPHFTPRYAPWDQRPNICFDGEVFKALRSGSASVELGHIERVDLHGVKLHTGKYIQGDVIIQATGLKVQFAGGSKIVVDAKTVNPGRQLAWNLCMLQDVPNAGFVAGYAHTSWTLGADARAWLLCRVIRESKDRRMDVVVPTFRGRASLAGPCVRLRSSYILAQETCLPRVTTDGPWKAGSQVYMSDYIFARYGRIDPGLEWVPRPSA
ncbi:hypothetical protein BJX64DRAFT_292797 [Aspergillus heterothallicus]